MKVEEGEEGEVDENGVAISSKRVRHFKCFPIQMLLCDDGLRFQQYIINSKDKLFEVQGDCGPPLRQSLFKMPPHHPYFTCLAMIMLFDHI